MDRTFGSPKDVSSATQDDVSRALNRVLRTLERSTNFIYQAQYEFANRRRGPLLMVGELRGAWREYVRRNAGSPSFAAGTCTVTRDEAGRLVLELAAERGRATGAAHQRAINSGPMHRLGEARFVDPATGSAAPPAAAAASGPPAPVAAAVTAPAEPTADVPTAAQILKRFNAFKTTPTTAALSGLIADIDAWRAGPGAATDANAAQIDKLAKMLAEKGAAYVASKGG